MTRRLKALRAMANQDDSPNERDIARAKLAAIGEGWNEPPRRPPVAAAPGPVPDPFGFGFAWSGNSATWSTSSSTTTDTTGVWIWVVET